MDEEQSVDKVGVDEAANVEKESLQPATQETTPVHNESQKAATGVSSSEPEKEQASSSEDDVPKMDQDLNEPEEHGSTHSGQTTDEHSTDDTTTSNENKSKNKRSRLIVAIFAIVLLVAAGIGIYSVNTPEAKRQRFFDQYIEQQVNDYGWDRDDIEIEDHGERNSVEIIFTSSDSSHSFSSYDENSAQEEAHDLAEDLNSFVFIFGYTSDGYLVSTAVAAPNDYDTYDEDEVLDANEPLFDRLEDARTFAVENSGAWLDTYRTDVIASHEGFAETYVASNEAGIIIQILQEEGWTTNFPTEADQQEFMDGWQQEVNYLTKVLGTNVGIIFYTSDGAAENGVKAYYADNQIIGYTPSAQD